MERLSSFGFRWTSVLPTSHRSALEVATNMGKRTFSPWATNTGKNNRQISTYHSTGGALSFTVPFIFVNIVHIYRVSIRLGLGVGSGLVLDLRLVLLDKTPL